MTNILETEPLKMLAYQEIEFYWLVFCSRCAKIVMGFTFCRFVCFHVLSHVIVSVGKYDTQQFWQILAATH